MSDAREEAAIARDALVRDKKKPAPLAACTPKPPEERRKALEQKRTNPAGNRRTSQIHYTCMNYWMQMG